MEGIRYYGLDDEQPKENRTLLNDLDHIFGGINQMRKLTAQDRELNDLKWKYYYDQNLTDDQLTEIENEYNRRKEELDETATELQRHKQYLDTGDSYASQIGRHALSAGSSLESMQGQYGANLMGALAGAALGTTVAPGLGTIGGAIAGWKATNIPTAIRANYRDAEAGAYDTWNEVMEKTGDPELAKQAFYESLKPNLGYAALATIPDIAITGGAGKGMINFAGKAFGKGSKAVERASRIAKAMERAQQSRIGRGIERIANKIPDIDLGEGAGAWVAGKFNNPMLGKVARGGVNLGAEVISEIGQEAEQGISTNAEVSRALHQYNPEQYKDEGGWSLDRAANWLNSEEGRTTMLDTAVSTLLTGGAQTALGGFAKLPQGYNNKYNLRNIDNIMVEMGQGGILQNISPEKLGEIKHVAGVLQGMQTDEEISAQSPEQAIRVWLEDASERAQKQKGLNEEEASAYAINNLINNATEFSGRPDYLSEASQAYFDKYKIQKAEGLIDMETRQREEQKAKEQTAATAKETHEGTIPSEVAPQSYIDGRKSGTIDKDGNPIQEQDTQQPSNTLQSKISNILPDGQAWSVDNTTATGEQYAEGTVLVKNNKTNKLVRVDRAPDGKSLFVTDITPVETLDENNQPVQVGDGRGRNSRRVDGRVMKFTTDEDGFKNLGKFFLDNQSETKTLKQERDEQSQQAAPPDPNRRRVMVNGVHDLANFYRQNSDLMDRDTFMLTVNNMMAYGNGNISLDLDLENDNNGIVGEVDPDEIDQMLRDGTSKAIIHLYQGADAITVLHEFAHVGYKMMSAHEQQLFNRMAEMSEASFVADMLKQVYPQYSDMGEDEIIGLVRQAAESGDGRVWRDISNIGVLRQTIDILNGGADEEQHQRACEERYAWEFTMWYIEGYTKGKQPTNRMQQMLNRTCGTLGKALELIGTVAERLQSDGWQAISNKSMVSMFENMNTRQFNTGNPNTQRMYGGYMTGEQQEQLQRERELAEQQAQQRAAQQAAMEQAIVEQYNGSPQQQNLSGQTQQTPATVSGEQQRAITTQRNKQRREQDTQKLQAQKEPVVLRELQKLVDGNENFTDNEAAMVQKLSPKGFAWYANRVLSRRYPNEGRMAIISSLDKDGKYKDAIEGKRYSALKRGNTFESRRNVRRSMKNTGDSVIGSLRTEAEQGVQTILRELLERKEQGQKQLQGYINGNKKNFETQKIYKEAMRRFKSMQTREAAKYDKIASETLRNAAWNSTGEIDRTEDGDSVYGTVNPPSVLDSLRRDAEEVEREKQRKYIEENEDKVQDKYKKLMDKYESGGLEAVGKTMNSPAIKKDPTFWNEAYNRLLRDVQQREEQKKAEEQQKQAEKEKAFANDVQKVVGLLNEKQKKSENSLKMFLVRNSKKFKEDPIYAEAKKRFDEGRQSEQETTQEQVQEKQQPAVQNEVQQQEQVQPASQTVQTEEAQPVVESKEEETTKQVEEPKAEVKEETTDGKTEDSGRVEDIRGTEGEVQTGRDSGVSTNQRPVLRPELRDKLEGTEAGHGEDVSLLRDKNDKPIGRKIPNINDKDSKTMQSLVEKAYGGNAPTDLSGWKQITKSKNKNGDNAITIYNKLFGTDLKEENYSDGDIYICEDGSAGYAVDNNGFCTVQVSGKKKGLLANAILVARNTKGVRYICSNTDGFTTASICSRLGFEPSGVLRVNGEERIVMRKVDMSEEDIIKGINAKSKPVIETKNLPIFYSQESLQKYDSVVENSEDKKQLTREDTTRTLDRVRRAVELFPSTSDDELQYLADTIDDTLSKKNSTSKTSSENLYLMNVLSDAAKEEINNRSGKAETDSEGEIVNNEDSVLESIYGAQELADERNKSKADTHTADELLSVALQPWRKREDKEQNNIKTAADESQTTKKKNTDTSKEDLSSILDKLESSLEDIDEQTNYANRVIDVAEREGYTQPTWLEEGVLDFDVDEDLNGLNQKQLENKMGKPKKEREAEKKEVKSEADEEAQAMEEAYDDMPEQAKPKNIHIQNSKVKQLNRYDTEDDWHRVCMSTITSDQGRNAGIKEKDDVSPSYVRNFLNGLKGKYEEDSATTLEEGILGTDIDEEDKKEIGRIYRKLSRQKALMDERFSKGLYGDWTDKTGDIFHIRTHAINYYKRLNKSLLGRVKMIMRNNGIHAFEYGFDEKDTKKKLTPKKLAELRKTAGVVQDQIDLFKEQRDSLKGQKGVGKQRRKLTRQISLLEDALNEIKTAVWANGQDMRGLTGKHKFEQERVEVREAAERARERAEERAAQPAKSVDKDLENSHRQKTIRNAQKRAEERASKSTPTLDSEVATDSSMQGSVVNWNKTVDKHGKTVAPILQGELKKAEDLMKLKPIQELADMSRKGQDVLGTFKKLNTLINAAVKHVQITKEQGDAWKKRIKDYTKALNDELSKPKQQPAKLNKTASKPKSTAKVTTKKQQKPTPVVAKNETTQGKPVSDKSFTNRMKLFVDNLKNGKESRTTVAKEGEVLTPQQQKLVDDALKKYQQKKKDNKTETATKQNKQVQKEKQNNNNKTKEADARETAVRKVKGAVYGNGLGNIHQLHQELAVAKRSPKGVLEKFIGELKKDYVQFYSIAKTLGSKALEESIDDSLDRVIKNDTMGFPHELDFNNKEELQKYFKEFSKYKSLKEFYKNEYNFDKDKFKAAAKKAAKEVDINNIPTLRTANMTNSSVYNILDTFGRKKTPEEVEKLVAEAKAKQNKNKSTKSRHMETDVIPDTSVEENRDINSITFTKSALKESKVNRDRAKALHDNNKYWKETKNPDGSITYTRQKRQPWHTKAVTYSGINGKEVAKEPLGKISEGFQRAWNWYKEKWLNEQTAIKDLAESVGAPEAWMDFVVQKDMGSLGMTAIERGIVKHNSKTKERTAALMDFAKEFKDEQEQLDWLDYCEAQRIVHDLHPKGIEQKMTFETANKIINKVKNSSNAKRFEEWRQKFVEYNKELLHVLVDGNIITEDLYQKLIKEHPNFIPLSKDMSDFDEAMSFMSSHKDLLNVKSPLHRIGSSLREVKNPLLEMQKRTMDYYQRAAQNKAALTFIDKIVTKITKLANGDEVMLNQAILHKLAPQYTSKGTIKDISDPNKGIFYVMRNGKKEFYQLSDASVYKALRSLSPEHMGGFEKFVNFLLSKPAQIVRTLATITFDFAIGNLYRDAGEAFMTSRHGYLPLYDSFWGMWQMYNDTEWFKEYNSQVGDMTSRIKENGRIAGIEDNVENQLFRIPVIGHIARAMSTFNEYMEQGTRIGEYKNARMGYEGTLGRLRGESANLAKAKNSKEYAAFRAKDITLNFLQHGAWGKKFNRVTPFFNAALQGQYKIINTIDEMIHNKEGMRNEMLLKAALIAYLSFMTGWNGAGDDDYEEAPDWERDNYTIRGDGSRTPKDQVLGKLIGNPFEQLGYYAKKGKFKNDAIDTLVDELKALALPDNLTPAFINLWIGLSGGHDTFKGKQIVPEYMKDDLGYLQKDLSTSNFATDLSKFAYDTFGIDVSAKKLDWSINQFLSNTGKYWNKIWDTARTEVTGEKNERTGHMYMEEDSKGAADYLNYSTGNNIIDGTLDLARMAFGKKFIQNQTTFDSLQDFNEEYLRLKRLSSDPQRITKEETKAYETIYKPAYDKIKKNRSKLSEIGKNSSLDKNQKLVKSRPIILDSIRAARDAEKAANKLLKK